MAEQTENLTYRQLADRLGLSLEAARAFVAAAGSKSRAIMALSVFLFPFLP